jgi:hypothetical protein
MLIPVGSGHDGNPHFTPPIPNGLVGSFDLAPAGDAKVQVVEHSWKKTANGFETTGTLLTNGKRLEQKLSVLSLGEKTVVYQDCVTALADVSIVRERGIPLGIENDKVTGGTRTVFHKGGENICDYQKPQSPLNVAGSWANVDGRLGVIAVESSGMNYTQSAGYHPGMAVCADVLYGSFSDRPKNFKAGEVVARRGVVLCVEVTSRQTATLAKSVKLENKPGNRMLQFRLPEGGSAKVPLL